MIPRFHLAFPVRELSEARAFYGDLLGCPEGRSSTEWADFFGHGAHLSPNEIAHKAYNQVDGEKVPGRHFGVILVMDEWRELAEKLKRANADFVIAPSVRFIRQNGEQATFFINDPSGNTLEFKNFHDETRIFAR